MQRYLIALQSTSSGLLETFRKKRHFAPSPARSTVSSNLASCFHTFVVKSRTPGTMVSLPDDLNTLDVSRKRRAGTMYSRRLSSEIAPKLHISTCGATAIRFVLVGRL
ncbi:hypothetical protein AG1IA_10332 [Rhizoctonia solani AG-1 IA]|uniref:Uncharacterized protein n=1 Tax=Thanatephorus cucumeris (strain AG1-IA) TaxID=983506 RepID=L8WFS4_THACA|nr:hypothetical protein AG1IA_10332 [Rhizoctonia solani AG-1 IA]